MAKKFDDSERDRCVRALPVYQKQNMSIRQMAKALGVSRSYIHRLSVELGISKGAMGNASERRRQYGWEPLPAGNSISCEAININAYSSEMNRRSLSSFFVRKGLGL